MFQILIYYIVFAPINALPFILRRTWRYKEVVLFLAFLGFFGHTMYLLMFNPVDKNMLYTRRMVYLMWKNERDVLLQNEKKKREDHFYKMMGDVDLIQKKYAMVHSKFFKKQALVIIIDNLGIDEKAVKEAIELPGEVTLSFSLFDPNLTADVKKAKAHGHDVLVDLPMADKEYEDNTFGNVELSPFMTEAEMQQRIDYVFSLIPPGVDGVINYRGIATRSSLVFLKHFFDELIKKKLLYVDTRFRGGGITDKGDDMPYVLDYAYYTGIPYLSVDYILNEPLDPAVINRKLDNIDALLSDQHWGVVLTQPYTYIVERLKNFFENDNNDWRLVGASKLAHNLKVIQKYSVANFSGGMGEKRLR